MNRYNDDMKEREDDNKKDASEQQKGAHQGDRGNGERKEWKPGGAPDNNNNGVRPE